MHTAAVYTLCDNRAGGCVLAVGLFVVVLVQALTLQQFIHGGEPHLHDYMHFLNLSNFHVIITA
jgi:hypothetical protein